MDTTSGETRSIWMQEALPRPAALAGDASTDICVIGGGIAGLTSAYLLARAGRAVLLLEGGTLGSGETGRTTAHLSDALDDRYHVLEKLHGADGARLAAQSHLAAIERIESIVRQERIDCAFEWLDGYLFRGREDRSDVLEKELEATHRAGLTNTQLTTLSLLPGFDAEPCLRFPRQGQFHPLSYLAGLARAAVAAGATVFTDTRVTDVEDGAICRATTSTGHTVTANEIVVATNSPISDRLAIHTKQAAYRTYAIALELAPDAVPTALYWDTEDPYHYVRTYRGADGRAALIVGGEDHKTGQADDARQRFERLEIWTRAMFPSVGPVRYRWSGQVQEPVDHLAFIGRDVGKQHVYIATGDSGHGMTHGTIAGMLITDLVHGRENPWAELYSPSRKSARAMRTYARENLNVARQLGDYLTPGDAAELAAVSPGRGAIVRQGAKKLAVYRDESGALHAHSAVCTHVGCIVHWNDLEKSWDCPCHGSRFDVQGQVLCGPAHAPLASVALGDLASAAETTRRTEGEQPRP